VYGVTLPRNQATLLKSQVTALTDQVKAGLIAPAALYPQLQALKIPASWQYAIVSTAAAAIAPKSGAIQISPFTGLAPPPPPGTPTT
jgi:hypothetical protein